MVSKAALVRDGDLATLPTSALDTFEDRHIGPDGSEVKRMLSSLGYESMDAFVEATVPSKIRVASSSVSNDTIASLSESELYGRARELAKANKPFKTVVPPVILRNIMESPAWYTPYTPRLESLVNYQTMIMSLRRWISPMLRCSTKQPPQRKEWYGFASTNQKKRVFLVDKGVLPQTIAVLQTRAKGFGIQLAVGDIFTLAKDVHRILHLRCIAELAETIHKAGGLVVCATDLRMGADIVLGNSARFGVPAGYGGPHGAFFACTDKLKRKMPGRLIGRSKDVYGKPAYRLALQSNQHCTAQALLANMAAMYAVYHGPTGLRRIAEKAYGYKAINSEFFDTVTFDVSGAAHDAETIHQAAAKATTSDTDQIFASAASVERRSPATSESSAIPQTLQRTSTYLPHPHEQHDPADWPEFSNVHPFAPTDQVKGYIEMIKELESDLCKITGFHACSVQPNSGAAGEYAGSPHRDICLIPVSAHGTNPAVNHADGNLDLEDLRAKAEKHKDNLAAFMITYPSTFGVFEDGVQDACKIIHENGGQVYLDGANLNAQIGLTNPATCGGDVCHMNLHKTFAIPHGGGGPVPICVAEHLAPFLSSHPIVATGGDKAINAVAAAQYGSASILLISWAYIKMLGGNGLSAASAVALLNANYMAHRLSGHYTLRYKNGNGRVAHELLIDLAEFDKAAGLKVTDFAKRLQDYGFHPPTCSWPISTCMLIEPTESEPLEEIDRYVQAMHLSRPALTNIDHQPKDNNPRLPSVDVSCSTTCRRPYSRQTAAFPMPWLMERSSGRQFPASTMCDCPSVEETAAH
ncbi:glycine cleavage system P-protein-domain-containing protein [Fomitopsis serialis]|uniref:glycine cleavage system P-protein-domain-containing protein n=1 Tax=Fomitopsis serialis TaxID=139415 RepID=UPI002008AC73|nr:glycine cleavage system P-protein-domain-containing protein [Neoantrodia serialis]KAH9937284.1 glycine cleavage system P-protein-domain-containing protein [Neoantrodia serialis]